MSMERGTNTSKARTKASFFKHLKPDSGQPAPPQGVLAQAIQALRTEYPQRAHRTEQACRFLEALKLDEEQMARFLAGGFLRKFTAVTPHEIYFGDAGLGGDIEWALGIQDDLRKRCGEGAAATFFHLCDQRLQDQLRDSVDERPSTTPYDREGVYHPGAVRPGASSAGLQGRALAIVQSAVRKAEKAHEDGFDLAKPGGAAELENRRLLKQHKLPAKLQALAKQVNSGQAALGDVVQALCSNWGREPNRFVLCALFQRLLEDHARGDGPVDLQAVLGAWAQAGLPPEDMAYLASAMTPKTWSLALKDGLVGAVCRGVQTLKLPFKPEQRLMLALLQAWHADSRITWEPEQELVLHSAPLETAAALEALSETFGALESSAEALHVQASGTPDYERAMTHPWVQPVVQRITQALAQGTLRPDDVVDALNALDAGRFGRALLLAAVLNQVFKAALAEGREVDLLPLLRPVLRWDNCLGLAFALVQALGPAQPASRLIQALTPLPAAPGLHFGELNAIAGVIEGVGRLAERQGRLTTDEARALRLLANAAQDRVAKESGRSPMLRLEELPAQPRDSTAPDAALAKELGAAIRDALQQSQDANLPQLSASPQLRKCFKQLQKLADAQVDIGPVIDQVLALADRTLREPLAAFLFALAEALAKRAAERQAVFDWRGLLRPLLTLEPSAGAVERLAARLVHGAGGARQLLAVFEAVYDLVLNSPSALSIEQLLAYRALATGCERAVLADESLTEGLSEAQLERLARWCRSTQDLCDRQVRSVAKSVNKRVPM